MMVPGRILVIDDASGSEMAKVDALIDSLRKKGESVLFFESMPEDDEFLSDVRLLIIDLYLADPDKDASYELVKKIVEITSKKSGFLVVAVWTKHVKDSSDNTKINEEIEDLLKSPQVVLLEPFSKEITPEQLLERLKASMDSNPHCGLIIEAEKSIEKARSPAVFGILNTATVPLLLKAIQEEFGQAAVQREIIKLFLKLISRYSEPSEEMADYIKKLGSQLGEIDPVDYGLIYGLQSYYSLDKKETIWCGDILKKDDKYAIVITPRCDFAQSKRRPIDFIKIIYANRFDCEKLKTPEVFTALKAQYRLKKEHKDLPYVLLNGFGLPERYYVLKYAKDENNTFYHLIMDFQRISHIPFHETAAELEEKEGWQRECRIDGAIVDDIMQKYSSHSSRIGIQSIPKKIAKSLSDELPDATKN